MLLKTDRVFSFALRLMTVSSSPSSSSDANTWLENGHLSAVAALNLLVGYCITRNFAALESRIYVMDNIVFCIAVLFVMNILCISRANRERLRRIHGSVRDYRRRSPAFGRLADRHLRSYLAVVGCLCAAALLFMNSLPLLVAVAEKRRRGTTTTLLFPCWFPWRVDTASKYAFTVLLQLLVGGALYAVVLGEILFLVGCMAAVRSHVEYFGALAATVDEAPRRYVGAPSPAALDEVAQRRRRRRPPHADEREVMMRRRYRRLIRHHQRMYRHIRDIVRCCGFYSSNSLLMFVGGFVFFSVILLENDKQSHIIYKTKILSSQLLSYQFVVFSYFGETISNLNDNFRQTMYATQWYDRRPKLKRTITIFMQLTHVPFKMSAFHMYTIRLGLLTYMLKTCFSLIQLLSRM